MLNVRYYRLQADCCLDLAERTGGWAAIVLRDMAASYLAAAHNLDATAAPPSPRDGKGPA